MAQLDLEPGRYASASGKWFFSCDSGESVLVGIQEPNEWTCPIVGMDRYPVTEEQIRALEERGDHVIGNEDGSSITMISTADWNRIMNDDIEDEWGNDTLNQCILFTDTDYVVRFHLAFE